MCCVCDSSHTSLLFTAHKQTQHSGTCQEVDSTVRFALGRVGVPGSHKDRAGSSLCALLEDAPESGSDECLLHKRAAYFYLATFFRLMEWEHTAFPVLPSTPCCNRAFSFLRQTQLHLHLLNWVLKWWRSPSTLSCVRNKQEHRGSAGKGSRYHGGCESWSLME